MPEAVAELTPLTRLTRDLKQAARTLSHAEARYLVDAYYQMQEDRIRAGNQVLAQVDEAEPHAVLLWLSDQSGALERQIARALDSYTDAHVVGAWAKSLTGIGPIISAGLLAHIDITKAPTVGRIWRFAGLDPTVVWNKGEKRPWNARLRTLSWKIGESFVKVSSNEKDFYGHLWLQRKALEQAKNEAGEYAARAAEQLARKRYGADTKARSFYERGQLPPGHLHARSKRWAVKLFLSHWHHVAYRAHYGQDPPKPYVLSILGHADAIQVPNWPF